MKEQASPKPIKISHGEKLDGDTCFVLMLLVRSDLVCRLPGKLHLSLAIWRTPEAIDLVGVSDGDVIMRLRGVATNWNRSWGNNYIRFQ